MAFVLADVGASALLKQCFNNVRAGGGNNLTLKLVAPNVTPADTSTAASFTAAAGGGYADKTLTMGSWTVSNVGGIDQAAYAIQTWTFTGALTTNTTIYGYYLVDADNVLIGAELLGAPFTPFNNGDQQSVTPIFQLSKGTPT